MAYKPTKEQIEKYNATRNAKRHAETPEEREARLAKRRENYQKAKETWSPERRRRDREARLAWVHAKKEEQPDWDNERYKRSKCKKAQRASELAKTLAPDEQLCSRCMWPRKKDDFPMTRTGERSTLCSKCYKIVKQSFDTDSLSYWKTRACAINNGAKARLRKLGRLSDETFKPVTGEQLQAMWLAQDKKCAYCGIPLNVLIMAYDHKDPISKDGIHAIENLQFLCHNCNVSKFTMRDEDYKKYIQQF